MFKTSGTGSSNGHGSSVFGIRARAGSTYRALLGHHDPVLQQKLLNDQDDTNYNEDQEKIDPEIAKLHKKKKGNELSIKNNLRSAKEVASQMTALLNSEFKSDEKLEPSCVICVGSTGTGKSSTIGKVTRRNVASGNGKDRVTIRCARYSMKKIDTDSDQDLERRIKDLVWVDTVGWDDADLQDDSTFKDILRFIGEEQLLRVTAILWCVLPNVRKDALLTKQARLINMFKPREIWNNVIILCKQSRNPEDDSQGALGAARQFNPKAEIPVLGYTYIDDPSLTMKQRKRFETANSLREDFLVKTDDEVRTSILETLRRNNQKPIQVVFRNQKCLDCGVINDVRLMPIHCHMEKIDVHPGSITQYHPKKTERYHDSSTVLREHPGGLYRPWYSCDFFLCKMGGERYVCCQALSGQPGCNIIRSCCKKSYVEGDDPVTGCKERFQCCKVNVSSKVQGCKSRYECCGKRVKTPGCMEMCKKCDRPWGTEASNCFEKAHNVVKILESKYDFANM